MVVAYNSVNMIQSLLEKVKANGLKDLFMEKNLEGLCPIHLAAKLQKQTITTMLDNAAKHLGVTQELLTSEGRSVKDITSELERLAREAFELKNREKELARQRKADEKLREEQEASRRKEQDAKIAQIKKEAQDQKLVEKNEEKQKAPYKLLMFLAILVLFLWALLKVGVATGATKAAAAEGNHKGQDYLLALEYPQTLIKFLIHL